MAGPPELRSCAATVLVSAVMVTPVRVVEKNLPVKRALGTVPLAEFEPMLSLSV